MLISNNALVDALKDSKAALDDPEKWFFSCTILSNILSEQGHPQLAYLWKSLARENDINQSTYHVLVGATYIQLEDWEQAIHHNKEAIAIDENLALAYSNLAKLYEKLEQPEEGLEYRYKFMSLRPDQTSADDCEELGNTLLKQGQAASALDCYRRAIQNNPEQWTAYYRIAHILNWAKQPDRAISYYQLLLERDSSQIEARQKLGKLLVEQQRYKEAVEQFQQTLTQQPDFNWAQFGLAQAFLALEQWDDTIEICQNALKAHGEQQWPYRHMAKAWLAKDQLSQVQICWQKIAALQGWTEWGDRRYHFTHDPLTHTMSIWHEQLQKCLDFDQRSTPRRVLQIGGAQGMWSCWMLDKFLTKPEDKLTYLPLSQSSTAYSNLEKTQSECSIIYKREQPTDILNQLRANSQANQQDLIYIQAKSIKAQSFHDIAHLSWPLLRAGGIMVFHGYQAMVSGQSNHQAAKSSIDNFLSEIEGKFEISSQEKHLFIMKNDT